MKISTDYKDFDRILDGGFECPSLIALGARPGMGKTFLLLSICLNWEEKKIPYTFISLELSRKQVSKRVDDQIPEKYLMDSKQISNIDELCSYIDSNSENTKIFLLDYLQLLTTGKYADPYIEISEIMNKLKFCSIRNEVSIIFASQLSRKVEERQGHRPVFSDFRDSGVIEENCDLVLFLLRREYYDANDKPGCAEIIVAKNRFGKVGSFNLIFDKIQGDYFDFAKLEPQKNIDEEEAAFSEFKP